VSQEAAYWDALLKGMALKYHGLLSEARERISEKLEPFGAKDEFDVSKLVIPAFQYRRRRA